MYYIHSLYNAYLCTVYNFTFMYTVQCTIKFICTVYNYIYVQCTVTFMYSVRLHLCTVYNCIQYSVQLGLCTVYNSVHFNNILIKTVYNRGVCKVYTMYKYAQCTCTVYNKHLCTVYIYIRCTFICTKFQNVQYSLNNNLEP